MLHFLYGDEFRVKQQLQTIITSAKQKYGADLLIRKINGQEINEKELHATCHGQDLFHKHAVVVISYLLDKAPSEKVTKVIESLIESKQPLPNEIIITHYGDLKKSKLGSALSKIKTAAYFEPMNESTLSALLLAHAKQNNALLPNTSAQLLISYCGSDAYVLLQELDKLMAYAHGATIDQTMIALLVPHENYDEIFSFLDAVATNKKALALKLLTKQIQKGEDEIKITYALTRQIRTLIHIKDLIASKGNLLADEIASLLGIHPYVAKKSLQISHSFTSAQLRHIYKYLQAIDRGIKNSYLDPQTLIETMIVKI
ncbi:DNA polymerase III subunit delta [Candidatus Falkowbacteria bacterium]|nr:DNA polymerase III subunit delta [Candidatus Falkowbacteria bacterium]